MGLEKEIGDVGDIPRKLNNLNSTGHHMTPSRVAVLGLP